MKIFDFTNGKKGRELANVRVMSGCGGHLVRKSGSDKVYKVELADNHNPSREGVRWVWNSNAMIGDENLTPVLFGVEAICFCSGQMIKPHEEWQWHVVGTCDWNKQACKDGILKATFSREYTADDRAQEAAREYNSGIETDMDVLCEKFETRQGLVEKWIETGVNIYD